MRANWEPIGESAPVEGCAERICVHEVHERGGHLHDLLIGRGAPGEGQIVTGLWTLWTEI